MAYRYDSDSSITRRTTLDPAEQVRAIIGRGQDPRGFRAGLARVCGCDAETIDAVIAELDAPAADERKHIAYCDGPGRREAGYRDRHQYDAE